MFEILVICGYILISVFGLNKFFIVSKLLIFINKLVVIIVGNIGIKIFFNNLIKCCIGFFFCVVVCFVLFFEVFWVFVLLINCLYILLIVFGLMIIWYWWFVLNCFLINVLLFNVFLLILFLFLSIKCNCVI